MAPLIASPASQQRAGPLRRATYVHVSDLIRAYNIDHEQLERELTRVNANQNNNRCGESLPDQNQVSMEEVAGDRKKTFDTIVPQKRLQPPRGGFNLCA